MLTACLLFPPQLMPLDKSRMHGVVNMRRHMLTELGWDPEWEVNPKELKLIEKIGKQAVGTGVARVETVHQCSSCQLRSILRHTAQMQQAVEEVQRCTAGTRGRAVHRAVQHMCRVGWGGRVCARDTGHCLTACFVLCLRPEGTVLQCCP